MTTTSAPPLPAGCRYHTRRRDLEFRCPICGEWTEMWAGDPPAYLWCACGCDAGYLDTATVEEVLRKPSRSVNETAKRKVR